MVAKKAAAPQTERSPRVPQAAQDAQLAFRGASGRGPRVTGAVGRYTGMNGHGFDRRSIVLPFSVVGGSHPGNLGWGISAYKGESDVNRHGVRTIVSDY